MGDIVAWLDERAAAVSNMRRPRENNKYGLAAAEIERLRVEIEKLHETVDGADRVSNRCMKDMYRARADLEQAEAVSAAARGWAKWMLCELWVLSGEAYRYSGKDKISKMEKMYKLVFTKMEKIWKSENTLLDGEKDNA